MVALNSFLFLLGFLGNQRRPQQQQGVQRQGGNNGRPSVSTSPFQISPNARQPKRPRLSLSFSPSQAPPGSSAELSGLNQFLSSGPSKIIKSCNRPNRRRCGVPSTSRGECVRRGCCWNPSFPVRCSRATYFVVSLREDVFDECGIPAGELVANSLRDPSFNDILLGLVLSGRIVGGVQAPEGEWPWTVFLYLRQIGIPQGQVCGGTLVNSRWVVTAAHCIQTPDPNIYSVALGINNLITLSGNEILRDVQTIIIHPLYDAVAFDYDVALLEMNAPVNFTRYVRPLCIVPSGTFTDDITSPFAGTTCVTVGWGNTTSPLGPTSDTLQQLNVIITPHPVCFSNTLTNAALFGNRPIQDTSTDAPKFCAAGMDANAQDSCVGDSGGPLFCLHGDGRYYLHGITSYGTEPCAIGLPGVYTKVGFPGINSFITSNIFT